MTVQIRLFRPWGPFTMRLSGAVLSTEAPLSQADGVLAEFRPVPELLTFPGRRAWYRCEPLTQRQSRRDPTLTPDWARVTRRLTPAETLNHAHSDPRYRVPHITHWGSVGEIPEGGKRIDRAVAVARNFGSWPWRWYREISLRNRFFTSEGVDLYGPRPCWKRSPRPWTGLPRNWRGELDGTWGGTEKHQLLSTYRVAICLENTCEPHYFTEKFVDAVRAGCVPVYHAHASVRDTVLRGATWVDPADHGFDVSRTLAAALDLDRQRVAAANQIWAQSPAVRSTEGRAVFQRIVDIMKS